MLNSGFNALVDARFYKPRLPIVEELHRIAPREPFRVVASEWMFLPNASAQYGLEDVRGSDPMSYARYTEALRPIVADDPSIDFDRVIDVHHPLLDALNVRYLMTEPGVEPGGRWRAVYRGADGSLFENPSVQGRFYVAEGEADVAVRQRGPARFEVMVKAKSAVRIASSIVSAPGWTVTPGERDDDTFVAFRLPAGTHTVELRYRPLSFWGSVPVAVAAVFFLAWRRSGIGLGTMPLRGIPTRNSAL